jgi:hypothetical protein
MSRYFTVEKPAITRVMLAPGAVAKIVDVKLPTELEPGKWITGSVFVDNVGDAKGKIASLIHTLWDEKWYGAWVEVSPTTRVEFTVPEGLIKMPDQDAGMEILAGVLLDGWDKFRRDDMRTWTVKKLVPPVWPEWWWIAALGGGVALIVVVGVVAYQERQREEMLMMMLMK